MLKVLLHYQKRIWYYYYTGNPLASVTSIVSLKLLEENPEAYRNLEVWHHKYHPLLGHFRVCGTIAAMDVTTKEESGYFNRPSLKSTFFGGRVLTTSLG